MTIANAWRVMRLGVVSRRILLRLLLLVAVMTGCASGPRTIDLMPAPAVFADGAVNLLPKGTPPISYDDFSILYATDRKPSDDPEQSPFYLNQAGFLVRMGLASVKAAPAGTSWQEARRISLSPTRRRGDFPIKLMSVKEINVLDSSYNLLTRTVPSSTSQDLDKEFADLIDHRLVDSGVKDIYIYVHGFRVIFDDSVLVSAQLWHFLGYRGAFIAYAWPSTPRALAYMSDLETARTMARKFRLFLAYLSENTQAERIHIVAFSAGSRLVTRALEQLALLNTDATDEQIRQNIRIGNVIIVGGDISLEEFGAALMDGMLRIPERTVIYMSSTDRALVWSRRILGRRRLGEMWATELPRRVVDFLRANSSLELIDVTGVAGTTAGNGHGYFRNSPWVSSDILTLLAFNLDPAQRGLEKEADQLVWRFPPDYIERLQKQLVELNPDWTGTIPKQHQQ